MEDETRIDDDSETLRPTFTASEASDEAGGKTQEQIGPYRLVEKVGEGGMGEVWLARQVEPVKRKVALKLIKQGMDSKQIVARFEAERQALAMMDHPAIAKVHDAGATAQGLPYFVMEYVEGVPITQHCDRHKLTNRQRLELFRQVCDGVQHAHQKAVIHRDLKPSNVLITIHDGKPLPKIIDFGVAKATAQPLTDMTMHTQLGSIIGTPEYMSPEQAGRTEQDVDTRADVYSLGVMLYELLVGALPFGTEELRQAGVEGMLRKIREEEPSKPSVRVSTLGERTTASASRRGTEPNSLKRELTGDLDWITMKALEKDRTRRYGSPSELSADIGRYLDDEPVLATPPSTGYRMKKFVRRHKVGVGAAAAGVLVLVAFAVTVSTLGIQAMRARADAERRRGQAEELIDYMLNDLHEGLDKIGRLDLLEGVARTSQSYFDSLTARDASSDDLSKRGRTLLNIGDVLLDGGDSEAALATERRAVALFESALEREPDRIEWRHGRGMSLLELGRVLMKQGENEAAFEAYRAAQEEMDGLVASVPEEREYRFASAKARYEIVGLEADLGSDTVVERLREVVAMTERLTSEPGEFAWRHWKLLLTARTHLAAMLRADHDLAAAAREYEAAVTLARRLADEDHANVIWNRDLAWLHYQSGLLHLDQRQPAAALASFSESRALYEFFARDDPKRVAWHAQLAEALHMEGKAQTRLGRPETALVHFGEALPVLERLASDEPDRLEWLEWLAPLHESIASAHLKLGDSASALQSFDAARSMYERVFEESGASPAAANAVADTLVIIGNVHAARNELEAARSDWLRALELIEPVTARSRIPAYVDTHVKALLLLDRLDEARPLVQELLDEGWDSPGFLELIRRKGLAGSQE